MNVCKVKQLKSLYFSPQPAFSKRIHISKQFREPRLNNQDTISNRYMLLIMDIDAFDSNANFACCIREMVHLANKYKFKSLSPLR